MRKKAMLIFVDLEHEQLQEYPELWNRSAAQRLQTKYRLEFLSNDACLIVGYDKISPDFARKHEAKAVFVSGIYSEFEHYSDQSLEGLRALYLDGAIPVMGFCAGFQLLAEAYGSNLGPIGPLSKNEPDPYMGQEKSWYIPGVKQERGFMSVNLTGNHPILNGLPRTPQFFQDHYWEVKNIPQGFDNFANTELCPIQFIVHKSKPLVGTQFHPEYYDEYHPNGIKIIKNFIQMIYLTKAVFRPSPGFYSLVNSLRMIGRRRSLKSKNRFFPNLAGDSIDETKKIN